MCDVSSIIEFHTTNEHIGFGRSIRVLGVRHDAALQGGVQRMIANQHIQSQRGDCYSAWRSLSASAQRAARAQSLETVSVR